MHISVSTDSAMDDATRGEIEDSTIDSATQGETDDSTIDDATRGETHYSTIDDATRDETDDSAMVSATRHENNELDTYNPNPLSYLAPGERPTPMTLAIPPGLAYLYMLCKSVYPDQLNPMQATALVKYWLGGPDPLDYISMYCNPGDRLIGIPPHWHYISFGLSDLHGDGRVHNVINGPDAPSGFGFELSFRLLKDSSENVPPTWPCRLMQSLAKYVFKTGNTLYAGDHVTWHSSLSGIESHLKHILVVEDPQLQIICTPFGIVRFVQMVGICLEELQAVQRWNGAGVIQILKRNSSTGGPWLITDMRRNESIFNIDPSVVDEIAENIKTEGSDLCGISAHCCTWKETNNNDNDAFDMTSIENSLENVYIIPNSRANNVDVPENSGMSLNLMNAMGQLPELFDKVRLQTVHIKLNLEAGLLLPFVLNGRIRHGRHFTFKAFGSENKITFVSSAVTGSLVDDDNPIVVQGSWLQILIPNSLLDTMEADLKFLKEPMTEERLPKTVEWPDHNLSITIVPDQF